MFLRLFSDWIIAIIPTDEEIKKENCEAVSCRQSKEKLKFDDIWWHTPIRV